MDARIVLPAFHVARHDGAYEVEGLFLIGVFVCFGHERMGRDSSDHSVRAGAVFCLVFLLQGLEAFLAQSVAGFRQGAQGAPQARAT